MGKGKNRRGEKEKVGSRERCVTKEKRETDGGTGEKVRGETEIEIKRKKETNVLFFQDLWQVFQILLNP